MGQAGSFVHLHCHSHYSLLDGAAQVGDLVKQAKSQGMNALALTDHGNLFGAIEFYNDCKKEGLNPIIGYEAYVAPAHRTDRVTRGGTGGEASFHLTMLAQNRTGFHNLIKMASAASLEGFYYRPRIDKELLEQYHEGLIILSGCASSEFSHLLLAGHFDEACRLAEWFAKLMPERFFVEIQDNGLEIQRECARGAIDVAQKVGLPLVATCDTHYLCSDDSEAHEVLLCINTGKLMTDPKRMQYGSNQFYLKSADEMYNSFPKHADAVQRSQQIADSIDIDLDFKKRHFPIFVPPPGKTDKEFLRDLCDLGMQKLYSNKSPERQLAARDRLAIELGVIEKLGFASYFLIVWDFVNFANSQGIPSGARGSACGALVSYLLGFSYVDPLEYDLLFERFLDPSRAEAPDIDIDFCQHRREEVIAYTRQKYGEKNVAQIITFGTMAARAVIRDVGRALDIPLPRVDQIAKLIPQELKITLKKALEKVPDLKKEYDTDPVVKRLIDIGQRLEGLARNPGTHAAGVVVADADLTNYVPLHKNGDVVTTQWEMQILEKVGVLKFDFLGLRNLTLLTDAVKVIEQSRGVRLDIQAFPLDDPATYTLLQRGETKGVFQLESEGIRGLLTRLRPDCFQDIIATAALYRPGPLGGGMVDKYINVKHGREPAEYSHAIMKEVLEETHGVMVYQEQVMRILNRLGGIELASAYKCIKAISKKQFDTINKFKAEFIDGAVLQGLTAEQATELFELITHFAEYGFNKSHSTAYALVAFQTAYLKAHYPAEFMAALLSSELDKTDLLVEHIDDCRRMGIEVKPPDVNQGRVGFAVTNGVIRFGLAAIKGVGEKAIDALIVERDKKGPFKNLYDLCERIDQRQVTKSCLESLIKAGALDNLGGNRAQLLAGLPAALGAGAKLKAAKDEGQGLLFGDDDEDDSELVKTILPNIPEWSDQEKLGYEKELLGIYLSSHPLAEHQSKLRSYATHAIADLKGQASRSEVIVGGMITGLRTMIQQRGRNANQQYARFSFEDLTGSIGCVMFADAFAEFKPRLANDKIVFLQAEIDTSREEIGLIVNAAIPLDRAHHELAGRLMLRVDGAKHQHDVLDHIARLLDSRPGKSPVFMEVLAPEGIRLVMKIHDEHNTTCDPELVDQFESLLGAGAVKILPPTNLPAADGNARNGRKFAKKE